MSRHDPLPQVTDSLREVWCAFAEHFLDTETRHELPWAALLALEAGLSIEQAHRVFRLDVAPVVGANLLSVAGEWAGWDRDWLCGRIEAGRAARAARPRWLTVTVDALSGIEIDRGATRGAVAAFMAALSKVPPEARRALAADLVLLGRHFFDFAPDALPGDAARRRQLLHLLDSVFLPAARPLVCASVEERSAPREDRLRRALA